MSKKSGGDQGSAKDYWGTIGALVCAGPVTELVAIVNDSQTIWPQTTEKAWAVGRSYALGAILSHTGRIWRCLTSNVGTEANAPGVGSLWTEQVVRRTDPGVGNPYSFDYFNPGQSRSSKVIFYWGEDDQNISTGAGDATFAATHPNYRRQCFVILVDWLFGRERVQAPSLSFVVRRKARQTFIPTAAALDSDGQCHPLAAEVEMLTDPTFGLGQPTTILDSASFTAEATAIQANTPLFYLSPMIDSTKSGRSFFAESLLYRDGWFRANEAGLIQVGRFAHAEAPPVFNSDNTIDFNDLEDEPQFTAQGWGETFNAVRIKFTNRNESYRQVPAEAGSGWNLAVTGVDSTQELDRPWITRAAQAASFAAEMTKVLAELDLGGTLIVRAPKVATLKAGDLFLFTHDAIQMSVICRVIERTVEAPPADRISLRFQRERGLGLVPYAPTQVFPPGAVYPDPETIIHYQFVQFSPSLSGLEDGSLSVLTSRVNPLTLGLKLHLRKDDGSGFVNLGTQLAFAVTGTILQNYPANLPGDGTFPPDDLTGTLRFVRSPDSVASDLAMLTADQTADAVNDNRLLLIAFNSSVIRAAQPIVLEDVTTNGQTATVQLADVVIPISQPLPFEVMTVISIAPVSGAYHCQVRRGRYGTVPIAFSPGDTVWVIPRLGLRFYQHASFPDYVKTAAVAYFRLQSFNAGKECDVGDPGQCPDVAYHFADPYAPRITWLSVRRDGVEVTDFSQSFPPGNNLWTFVAQVDDLDQDITGLSVTVQSSASSLTLLAEQFEPVAAVTRSPAIRFQEEGEFQVVAIANDAGGRISTKELTAAAGGSPVTIRIVLAGSSKVQNPVPYPKSGTYRYVNLLATLSCPTPGAQIVYQLTAYGKAPSGTWINYTGGNISIPLPKSLHAYASAAGMIDSTIIEARYAKAVWW